MTDLETIEQAFKPLETTQAFYITDNCFCWLYTDCYNFRLIEAPCYTPATMSELLAEVDDKKLTKETFNPSDDEAASEFARFMYWWQDSITCWNSDSIVWTSDRQDDIAVKLQEGKPLTKRETAGMKQMIKAFAFYAKQTSSEKEFAGDEMDPAEVIIFNSENADTYEENGNAS